MDLVCDQHLTRATSQSKNGDIIALSIPEVYRCLIIILCGGGYLIADSSITGLE